MGISSLVPSQWKNTTTSSCHAAVQYNDKKYDLQQFWNLQATGTTPVNEDNSDKGFLTEYSRTFISRQTDGSYCAKLPWKPIHPPLPTNSEICWKRARSLVHRLSHLLQIYDKIIAEQVKKGFIEMVSNTHRNLNKVHYIPHHCIKKISTNTPIRIIYDYSCRQSSDQSSLNDCLLTGPHFLNDLCSIILCFRIHNYAISTDIEKAFLHVNLHKDDRDYSRFFWLKDVSNPNDEFDTYRFRAVLYIRCSEFTIYFVCYTIPPFTATQHPFILCILCNLYVDNILSGCPSEDEIIQYNHNARATLSEAHFNLRAWVTNSLRLRAITQQEKTADSAIPSNVLGILWNPISDQLLLAPKGPLTTGNSPLQRGNYSRNPRG